MVWQFVKALVDMNHVGEIFSLPKKQVYSSNSIENLRRDETFIEKPAWTYDLPDNVRVIIPYQKDLVDNWLAIETQDDIFWHSILSEDVKYRNILGDEENPFTSESNRYGAFAFFVKSKGTEAVYSLMDSNDMLGFCGICCDVFSLGSENTRLSKWVKNNGINYSLNALAYYFCRKDNSIKRGVAYHKKGIFGHKND